jgi:hypothetical protein
MVNIVEQLCERLGNTQARIVVEADGFEEAGGLDAKRAVENHAVKMGCSKGGISDNGSCYGVDEQGKTSGTEGAGLAVRFRREYMYQEGI